MTSRTPPAAESASDLIGGTPLVRLNRIPASLGIRATVWVKVEAFNAGGSVKDRISLRMIEEAENQGRIRPGDTLIEPTSGNTGIGLALVGAIKGYRVVVTLPEKMSAEKVAVLRALGATIIRTPTDAPSESDDSNIGVAKRLQAILPRAHILNQYSNPANPDAHDHGTADEIWRQTGGRVDVLVAGAGTGGTITGLARGLRRRNPHVRIVGADPHGSILALPSSLNDERQGEEYQIEGIGYDFIPDVLDRSVVDRWYKTTDIESFTFARRLIAEEGLLVGGSSGAAIAALAQAAKDDPDNIGERAEGKHVVVVLPDSIRSYLSKFVNDGWLKSKGLDQVIGETSDEALVAAIHRVTAQPAADDDKAPQSSRTAARATAQATQETPVPQSQSQPQPLSGASALPQNLLASATVRSLNLMPVITIVLDSPCSAAVDTMNQLGYDQLPVLSKTAMARLVGLVSLSSLLSQLSAGRASPTSPVSDVMFDFRRLPAVPAVGGAPFASARRKYVQITQDTPLTQLLSFFEWNSAAIVTEPDSAGGPGRPVSVATKMDLVTWMMENGL